MSIIPSIPAEGLSENFSSLISKAIRKSQHCQRNWDLAKQIPDEHMEVFQTAVTQCPSKQNLAFYNVYFIRNRELIEKIHSTTQGFVVSSQTNDAISNSQVLANLLVVFTERQVNTDLFCWNDKDKENIEIVKKELEEASGVANNLNRDRNMAVGIAAGYLNLSANLLGYSTGCCACFEAGEVSSLLQTDEEPLLLMGVGFRDMNRSRLEHHLNSTVIFPSLHKQHIKVNSLD